MNEQELTALATNIYEAPQNQGRPHYQRDLAEGYLTLKAERDALKLQNISLSSALAFEQKKAAELREREAVDRAT